MEIYFVCSLLMGNSIFSVPNYSLKHVNYYRFNFVTEIRQLVPASEGSPGTPFNVGCETSRAEDRWITICTTALAVAQET